MLQRQQVYAAGCSCIVMPMWAVIVYKFARLVAVAWCLKLCGARPELGTPAAVALRELRIADCLLSHPVVTEVLTIRQLDALPACIYHNTCCSIGSTFAVSPCRKEWSHSLVESREVKAESKNLHSNNSAESPIREHVE
eukprot:1713457-Amphidinium_carterae.1